jgi:hypothetical protein
LVSDNILAFGLFLKKTARWGIKWWSNKWDILFVSKSSDTFFHRGVQDSELNGMQKSEVSSCFPGNKANCISLFPIGGCLIKLLNLHMLIVVWVYHFSTCLPQTWSMDDRLGHSGSCRSTVTHFSFPVVRLQELFLLALAYVSDKVVRWLGEITARSFVILVFADYVVDQSFSLRAGAARTYRSIGRC